MQYAKPAPDTASRTVMFGVSGVGGENCCRFVPPAETRSASVRRAPGPGTIPPIAVLCANIAVSRTTTTSAWISATRARGTPR